MKVILTRGYIMDCNPETYFKFLMEIGTKLHADKHGYAIYSHKSVLYKYHRWVMGCTNPKLFVAHLDANPCNNWEWNLEIVTQAENQRNTNDLIQKNNSSGYRGIYWSKRDNCWFASIGFNKRLYPLGYFKKLEDAIEARKQAEIQFDFTR